MRQQAKKWKRPRRKSNVIRKISLKKKRIKRRGRKKKSDKKSRDYRKGYEKGMQDGIYSGGDAILDSLLPGDAILPEIPIQAVIAAGLEQMRPQLYPIIQTDVLGERIINALQTHTPLSFVRLGDGELLTLAQDVVLSTKEVLKRGPFLTYAGVNIPDLAARDQLLHAIRGADVVGIPKLRLRNYLPLAFSVFRAYGIDYRSLRLTDSLNNYYLYKAGYLSKFVSGQRVLTVGNMAPALAEILVKNGVHVVGAISPIEGVKDVPRVMEKIRKMDFDIALISAGISAVILAQKIASEMGKVAIDFGHLADSMVKGEAPYF
jgi:hypothetical protein